MTFKKSLGKRSAGWRDLRYVLWKNGWIFLIGLAAFLLLIPFSTAGLSGSSIFNIEVTHQQMKFRLFHPQAIPAIIGALVVLGIIAGCALFRFVLDKKETTIFFSMGMTRTRLFVNRLAAGMLMLALAVALPMALSFWLNLSALGGYEGLLRNTVYLTVGMFAVSMVSFLAAAISIFAAGTLAEACVYWAGLMLLPTILCSGLNLLLKALFWGNAWGELVYSGAAEVRPSLVGLGTWWNPILFFLEKLQTHGQFVRPLSTAVPEAVAWGALTGWLIFAVLLAVIAWLVLRRRRAELAGMTAANPVLSECVILLSGFFAFTEIFSLLYSYEAWLAAVLGGLGVLVVHLFWRKTLFSGSAAWRRGLCSLVLNGAALGLVCLVCGVGLTANTARFLSGGEIAQARVSYVGAPQFLYGEVSGSSTGRGYYVMSELTLDTPEAIEKVKDLQALFLQSGRKELGNGSAAADTVVPYDICFAYTDTDGREHIWYYDRCSFAQLEAMLSIEDEEEVRQRQAELFSMEAGTGQSMAGQAYASSEIYLTDPYLTNTYRLTLSGEQRALLLQALRQDTAEMSLEQRYFPEGQTRAVLMFTDSGEQDCKYYTYHLNNEYLYLTGAYSHTLSWLAENELLSLVSTAPQVEYIVLQKFDPYIGINGLSYPMGMYFMAYCADTANEFVIQKDFGKQYTITDEAEIQAILSGLQDGCSMTRGGYLAAVKIAGEARLRYLFLPQAQIPDFVVK